MGFSPRPSNTLDHSGRAKLNAKDEYEDKLGAIHKKQPAKPSEISILDDGETITVSTQGMLGVFVNNYWEFYDKHWVYQYSSRKKNYIILDSRITKQTKQ